MSLHDLSARELDVYKLAIDGLSNARIASELHISETTVKTHMTRVLRKAGVHSRAELAARADRSIVGHEALPDAPGHGAPTRSVARGIRLAMPLAAAAAVLVIAGVALAAHTPQGLPEFSRPQTAEDVLVPESSSVTVLSSSTRFVATVEGLDIYLAHQPGAPGVCVVTTATGTAALVSTGCSSSPSGDAVFRTANGLAIAVGNTSSFTFEGALIPLSESVRAYFPAGPDWVG